MTLDDNVWNDRDTDDFLRYLKFEYFMLCYFMSFAAMEALAQFGHLIDSFEYLQYFGKNTGEDIYLILGMFLGLRLMHFFWISIRFVQGKRNFIQVILS